MTTGTMAWSKANRIGLILLAVYGVANLIPAPPGGPGDPGPPQAVIVADIVLGIIIIASVIVAWRNQNRGAAMLASVAAILAALTAVPAFFVDGVPTFVRILVGFFTVWTVLAVALTLSKPTQ